MATALKLLQQTVEVLDYSKCSQAAQFRSQITAGQQALQEKTAECRAAMENATAAQDAKEQQNAVDNFKRTGFGYAPQKQDGALVELMDEQEQVDQKIAVLNHRVQELQGQVQKSEQELKQESDSIDISKVGGSNGSSSEGNSATMDAFGTILGAVAEGVVSAKSGAGGLSNMSGGGSNDLYDPNACQIYEETHNPPYPKDPETCTRLLARH